MPTSACIQAHLACLPARSGNFAEAATFKGAESHTVDKSSLFPVIADLRVYKTEAELRVMRYVSEVTSAAHVEVMRQAQPGWYEVRCGAGTWIGLKRDSAWAAQSFYCGPAALLALTLATTRAVPTGSTVQVPHLQLWRLPPRGLRMQSCSSPSACHGLSFTAHPSFLACRRAFARAGPPVPPCTTAMLAPPTTRSCG